MFDVYCETPSDSGKIEEKNGSDQQIAGEQGGDAHMLRGEKIVFTGKLDTFSRKQAQALVTALGGKAASSCH